MTAANPKSLLFAVSVLFAIAVHGVLFAVADKIHLASFHAPLAKPIQSFHVKVREVSRPAAPTPEEVKLEDKAKRLSTRPGAIEDLLKREQEAVAPLDTLLTKTTDIPQLANRLAGEVPAREHAIAPTPEALKAVDAKIVEIAQYRARQDIEIARRLVTPSSTRVLGENEFPALGGKSAEGDEPISFGNMPALSLLDDGATPSRGAIEQESGKPRYEDLLPMPGPAEIVVLPEETRVAPVAKVVEEIKQENPYEFMDDMVDVTIDTYCPAGEKKGFFRVQISPKKNETIKVLPKDVTFVIDASTSIIQHKLDATVKGTRGIIDTLRPEDHFNVVVFRDGASHFQPQPVPATPENMAAAAKYLQNLESRGETNVYNAIRPVIQSQPRTGVASLVLVMTDGRPTAGVRDARAIINALSEENVQGNTVFAYGGGGTVNRYLLDLLAYRNKGESRVFPSIEGISKDLPDFFRHLNDPLLVNLNADFGRIDQSTVFPKEVPDFYRGRAVTIYGRFDPAKDKEFSMRLAGKAGSAKKEVIFKAALKGAANGPEDIARNWAFQKIYYLIDKMCEVGEKPELLAELRDLSRKYNIKTSYDE